MTQKYCAEFETTKQPLPVQKKHKKTYCNSIISEKFKQMGMKIPTIEWFLFVETDTEKSIWDSYLKTTRFLINLLIIYGI